jgi:hypothetical protein
MNSLKQEALRLNNEGVMLLLLESREQHAMNCLTQSLNMVKHLLAKTTSDDSRSSSNPLNKALKIQPTAHSLPNLQYSNGFIYCSLLAFSLEKAEETVPSEDNIQVYSALIILNIALAYHRRGVSGNEACLAKAENMYVMVTKLLSDCENNQGIALVAKLASINNLSLIRHSRGDYNFSRDGFQYLGDLMDVAGENLTRSSLCSAQMYQGMLLNILCVVRLDAAPAA